LIAAMTTQATEAARARITIVERFRTVNRVTLDAPGAAATAHPGGRRSKRVKARQGST
jgi:hypothetical protein